MTTDSAQDEYFDGHSVASGKSTPQSKIEIVQAACLHVRVDELDMPNNGLVDAARFLALFKPPYHYPLDPADAHSEGIDLKLPLDRQEYVDAPNSWFRPVVTFRESRMFGVPGRCIRESRSGSNFAAEYLAAIEVIDHVGPFPIQIKGVPISDQRVIIVIVHHSYQQFRNFLIEVGRMYRITEWLKLQPEREPWLTRLAELWRG